MWYDSEFMNGKCGDMNFDPEFKNVSIMEQLAKILDSAKVDVGLDVPEAKYKAVETVTTDDGDIIKVTAAQAEILRNAVLNVPVKSRLETLKKIQTTKGLTSVLNAIKL
jgi:hypothetical protein